MSRLLRWLLPGVVLAVGVLMILFVARLGSVRDIYCDGAAPVWMLEAQDYDGGGCFEVLPSGDAPPNADWRPYCTGMCLRDYPANRDYSFRAP